MRFYYNKRFMSCGTGMTWIHKDHVYTTGHKIIRKLYQKRGPPTQAPDYRGYRLRLVALPLMRCINSLCNICWLKAKVLPTEKAFFLATNVFSSNPLAPLTRFTLSSLTRCRSGHTCHVVCPVGYVGVAALALRCDRKTGR